jgi:beta-fructofuranosidase
MDGPYGNYFDNVLLPKGNYAARVCDTPDGPLLFNFFSKVEADGQRRNMLPPPKRLVTDDTGRLRLTSSVAFDAMVQSSRGIEVDRPWDRLLHNAAATQHDEDEGRTVLCPSGYEAFLLPGVHEHFRLRCRLALDGIGKCGLVFRVDEQGNGYYLSLDLVKGVAQVRAWGEREDGSFESAFAYTNLQAGYFVSDREGPWQIDVTAYGQYLECAINGYVILTLADDTYHGGRLGFYVESTSLTVQDAALDTLQEPRSEEHGPLSSSEATMPGGPGG